MKKYLALATVLAALAFAGNVLAQTNQATTTDPAEAHGRELIQQLQTGSASCSKLTRNDFIDIGDYYSGLMMGNSQAAMEEYLTRANGNADYTKSMYEVMGERISGCNVSASFPQGISNFGPMMRNAAYGNNWNSGYGMMGGWGNYDSFTGYSMMGRGSPFGFGWGGSIYMIVLWVLAGIGLITSIRWLVNLNKK